MFRLRNGEYGSRNRLGAHRKNPSINASRTGEAGETITIARGKVPVAKLVPVAPKTKREFGAMRGKYSIGPEFFDPPPDDELDRWER